MHPEGKHRHATYLQTTDKFLFLNSFYVILGKLYENPAFYITNTWTVIIFDTTMSNIAKEENNFVILYYY